MTPVHLQNRSKRLKELAFTSLLFGFVNDPPSERDIDGWFSSQGSNIGLVCGVDNLVVLDFDKPSLFERWRNKNQPLVARTPVGKSPSGYHVLLRHGLPIASSSLHLGLQRAGHIKALGGYVVCAPSELNSGKAYSWLPGQSPFEADPQEVRNLAEVGLHPVSPLKRAYDGFLNRGSFEDH